MTNTRIPTETLRQIIQLHSNQLSTRAIARAVSLSQGAVWKYGRAVLAAGLTWEEALTLQETELERRVWEARVDQVNTRTFTPPDYAWIHAELKSHKHVTLQLLWQEYQSTHGALALRYSSFCEHYRHWSKRLQRSMRQRHYAGDAEFPRLRTRRFPELGTT